MKEKDVVTLPEGAKEIAAPPAAAATASLSDGAQLTITETEISKDELIAEYVRRLTLALPIVKRLSKNQLIRVIANILSPPFLLPLKQYKTNSAEEDRALRAAFMAMDAQIALTEFIKVEQLKLAEELNEMAADIKQNSGEVPDIVEIMEEQDQ